MLLLQKGKLIQQSKYDANSCQHQRIIVKWSWWRKAKLLIEEPCWRACLFRGLTHHTTIQRLWRSKVLEDWAIGGHLGPSSFFVRQQLAECFKLLPWHFNGFLEDNPSDTLVTRWCSQRAFIRPIWTVGRNQWADINILLQRALHPLVNYFWHTISELFQLLVWLSFLEENGQHT